MSQSLEDSTQGSVSQNSPAYVSQFNTTAKSRWSTLEGRREYQRKYYQINKEKAKEYQRQYNLIHKRTRRGDRRRKENVLLEQREVIKSTYTASDIVHLPIEKSLKILEKIIRGERLYTGI